MRDLLSILSAMFVWILPCFLLLLALFILVETARQIVKSKIDIMAFIIDRQTINDLNIFGKVRGNSVYGVFNSTRTRGGGARIVGRDVPLSSL